MKNLFNKTAILFLITFSLLLGGCEKEAIGEDNSEELITTVQLTFTPVSGGEELIFSYEDLDGPGGNDPVIDVITLAAATTYEVQMHLFNKTTNPIEDITEEIEEEADAHRFYFEPSAGSNIAVLNLNNDENGNALGTQSTWQTGVAATGKIKITLRHYPGFPPDKAIGDPVDSRKSSTDAEVEFVTVVE